MSVEIRRVTRNQMSEAGKVIAESLLVEPGFVSVIPDAGKRLKVLTPLMTGALRHAVRLDSGYAAVSDCRVLGVAVWLPPGTHPSGLIDNLRMLPSLRGMIHIGLSKARDMATTEKNAEAHFPDEPVWYLQALGVSPEAQGQGIGTRLIQPVLDRADVQGDSCYLETGTERNVRFYERFGFEIREADVRLAPYGPTHWTMIRRPQPITTP